MFRNSEDLLRHKILHIASSHVEQSDEICSHTVGVLHKNMQFSKTSNVYPDTHLKAALSTV